MHFQNTPCALIVRPDLSASVLRMLDAGAEQYDEPDDSPLSQTSALFRSLGDQIRGGESIDLAPFATISEAELDTEFPGHGMRTGEQLVLEASFAFQYIEPHQAPPPDWRYLSDLAGFAADIEAAFGSA